MSNMLIMRDVQDERYLKVTDQMIYADLKPNTKVIWLAMLNLPDDDLFKFNPQFFKNKLKNSRGEPLGQKAVDSALSELKDKGYMMRVGLHDGVRVRKYVIAIANRILYKFDRKTQSYPVVTISAEDADVMDKSHRELTDDEMVNVARVRAEIRKALKPFSIFEPAPPQTGVPDTSPPPDGPPFTKTYSIQKQKKQNTTTPPCPPNSIGEGVIETKPERILSVMWLNHIDKNPSSIRGEDLQSHFLEPASRLISEFGGDIKASFENLKSTYERMKGDEIYPVKLNEPVRQAIQAKRRQERKQSPHAPRPQSKQSAAQIALANAFG